jgi:hypothetical protein
MRLSLAVLAGAAVLAVLALVTTSRKADSAGTPRAGLLSVTSLAPDENGTTTEFTNRAPNGREYVGASGAWPRASDPAYSDLTPANFSERNSGVPRPRRMRTGPAPLDGSIPEPRTSGTPEEFLSDALFRRLDVNGDGVLSGDEIPTSMRLDADEYGRIDAETFTLLFQAAVQRARENRNAVPLAGTDSAAQPAVPTWFAALDPNGTGSVDLNQWRAAGRDVAEFRRMDTDGDGVLTLREVQAFGARSVSPPVASTGSVATGAASTGTASFGNPDDPTQTTRARADTLLAHYTTVASGVLIPKPAAKHTASAPAKSAARPEPPDPAVVAGPPAKLVAKPVPAPAKAAPAPAPPAPPAEVATLPMPLTGDPHWVLRNTENELALLAGDRPNVLFLGDSITELLMDGA